MATYPPKTPGVYVQEQSILPPSVAAVSTAIPAFLGYTEISPDKSVAAVRTLLEYVSLFGGPQTGTIRVTSGGTVSTEKLRDPKFLMYYAVSHYFLNGGGLCYIVSLGDYTSDSGKPAKDDFLKGLEALKKEDEPTLILLTDAVNLARPDYYDLCQQSLNQCVEMGNRFCIFDIKDESDVTGFRNKVTNNLGYGAAYYPYLNTTLTVQYKEKEVNVDDSPVKAAETFFTWGATLADKGIKVRYIRPDTPYIIVVEDKAAATPEISIDSATLRIDSARLPKGTEVVEAWERYTRGHGNQGFDIAVASGGSSPLEFSKAKQPLLKFANWEKSIEAKGITVKYFGPNSPSIAVVEDKTVAVLEISIDATSTMTIKSPAAPTGDTAFKAWEEFKSKGKETHGFEIEKAGDGAAQLKPAKSALVKKDIPTSSTPNSEQMSLKSIETKNTQLYQTTKAALAAVTVTLPPSAAVAGIYASVDRDRGVWKAPANVGITSVIGPVVKITNEVQENLNVDPTSGKSINAIRAFAGKGTLVWGARTLLGNDDEWRYVPVRRLFSLIEESSRKATAFAVFEPNDLTTWLKVKGMIESFLYGLWEQGALAGSTPDAAYFVNVGLGKTMTAEDVLRGRMIVEIGAAAVRPAEFIILRFTHKLQQA